LASFQGALIFVSHDRYFVDKIAKKLFIFEKDGVLQESYQKYTQYLEDEKDKKYLEVLQNNKTTINQPAKQNTSQQKKKLSYKEQKEYEKLPQDIEKLETTIQDINDCLSDPNCYKVKGIVTVSKELSDVVELYDNKIERFLELEQMIEDFAK
jgi:ATP-binding cassette subfamily F protein uup